MEHFEYFGDLLEVAKLGKTVKNYMRDKEKALACYVCTFGMVPAGQKFYDAQTGR